MLMETTLPTAQNIRIYRKVSVIFLAYSTQKGLSLKSLTFVEKCPHNVQQHQQTSGQETVAHAFVKNPISDGALHFDLQ